VTPLRATYRLQLGPGMGFEQARELVPYLRDLGVSHLYLPPSFQAREGSTHGYDVVDPGRISEELGGEEAFRALVAAVRDAGLGIVLDIVPNHMATDDANRWWADPALREKFFDIDPETGRHRRFFDIDHLAGVRQEDPEVFAATHELALRLVREGAVDGLRIDHPDGLADPAGYLQRLREGGAEHVWVEKILDPGETLRDWPVEGTVGYEFLNDVAGVYVDRVAEGALTALWEEVSGDSRPFGAVADEAKLEQARGPFAFDAEPAPEDLEVLEEAGLRDWLLAAPADFLTRFQQTTPPVMAKGVEDTAFYRHARLLALNDVGGDPGRFGISVEQFHEANRQRADRFPRHLLVTQTHDTKRSGDVRARIGALSTMPGAWASHVRRWFELTEELVGAGGPDSLERYFVFQTLAGAWPIEADRMVAYMEKALREAKRTTNWIEPNEEHERAVERFVRALYSQRDFLADFEPFAAELARVGDRAALGQLLLKLTVPGLPDIYQGDELLALSLVDPDNRRAVDWEHRRTLLDELRDGAEPTDETRKLWLIQRALELRARRPEAFDGSYTPLEAGEDTVAFRRGEDVIAVALLRGDGAGGEIELPEGRWHDALSGAEREGGRTGLAELAGEHGIALLERA
jgi:(1->4)-alpha-D-glucan 1-alpha-D-glucosylmutase